MKIKMYNRIVPVKVYKSRLYGTIKNLGKKDHIHDEEKNYSKFNGFKSFTHRL